MGKAYKPLTVPKLVWDKKTLTESYGELVAQPLEPGFGITFGTVLRRILLGGVEGAAVTSFIMQGVNSEFSAIPGVEEDAMTVALNIKGIVVKNLSGLPGTMKVKKEGAGAVTVGDIEAESHLELINKDHVIAHVAENGLCEIQFFVENGRGYMPAQWPHDKSFQEDGRIWIDAMFSPISRVMMDVEKTRVGQDIDYDKLIMRIYTNGSLNPVDALHYATSVAANQLEQFLSAAAIPFNQLAIDVKKQHEIEQPVVPVATTSHLKGMPLELLLKPIEELELSVRAHNCLKNDGIERVLDLVNLSEDGLLGIKNFGRKSLQEVKDSVKAFGLSFGMNLKEADVIKMLEAQKDSH